MNYYKRIDGLRFVAIAFVFIEHFAGFIGKYFSAGYYGVDLFFVISGFLITNILLDDNGNSFKTNYSKFLGRRTLRIFPVYYLTLLILWLLNIEDVRDYLLSLVTYSFNYTSSHPTAPVRHFWSLCVEEQFYLFWPFVIMGLRRQPTMLGVVMLAIIALGYLQMMFSIFPAVAAYNYWGIFPRMASLALGGFGALLSKKVWIPRVLMSSKFLEYLMLGMLVFGLTFSFAGKPLLLGLVSLFLVLKASQNGFKLSWLDQFLQNRRVVFIGTISYGMYLFHPIIEYLFAKYIFDTIWLKIDFSNWGHMKKLEWHSWIIKFPLYSCLSIVVAAFSFRYFEKPILQLKSRWFPAVRANS